jgi:hypothetical protein
MIGLFLLLSAQAAVAAPADAPPPAPPPTRKVCRKAPGSDMVVCRPAQQQQEGSYRLPRYGPAAPTAQSASGNGVKVRAQASNRGTARRNRPTATVGIPF